MSKSKKIQKVKAGPASEEFKKRNPNSIQNTKVKRALIGDPDNPSFVGATVNHWIPKDEPVDFAGGKLYADYVDKDGNPVPKKWEEKDFPNRQIDEKEALEILNSYENYHFGFVSEEGKKKLIAQFHGDAFNAEMLKKLDEFEKSPRGKFFLSLSEKDFNDEFRRSTGVDAVELKKLKKK